MEVNKEVCEGVKQNLVNVCELYEKSRYSYLSVEEIEFLREEVTVLFYNVSKIERSAARITTDIAERKGLRMGRKRRRVPHTRTIDKRCAECGTTSTYQWRRGEDKNVVLCNKCGLRINRSRAKSVKTNPIKISPSPFVGCSGHLSQRESDTLPKRSGCAETTFETPGDSNTKGSISFLLNL